MLNNPTTMKKIVLKPGFEFIFSLSLIIVLGLPPMLLAQNRKDVDINIVNGDTTVNGKNIKDLSASDRAVALKDINRMSHTTVILGNKDFNTQRTYTFKRRSDLDSTGNMINGKPDNLKKMDYTYSLKLRDDGDNGFRARDFAMKMRAERKNTQNFDYVSTDNEGISTRVRFRVSEISNEDLKKMPHVEGGKFEITDLNVVPEFSTGKTLLIFDLPAKTVATVKLTDSEGKLLFEEKTTSGSFSKTFPLGLNGIYFLQVKQGNNIAIKKIVKEE
jgi:hypothetical protein